MEQLMTKVQLAKDSKKTARFFTYGNLLAITFPALFVLWFGASILVYAICRHHPNPRVGFYTQRAAYCYYAVAGALVPCLAFSPEGFIKDLLAISMGGLRLDYINILRCHSPTDQS